MDRKAFGQLLAVLRAEVNQTQAELAELSDVDPAVISNLERGTKRHLDPDLLFKLANAFKLTTLERHEFFLAASGLDATQVVRQPDGAVTTDVFDAEKVVRRLSGIVGKLRLPAYLVDVYGDIVCANRAVLDLFQLSPEAIAQAALVPGGYSAVRLVASVSMRASIAEGYDGFLLTAMRGFREVSLRYRARPYFQYLMKEFRDPQKYPWFERTWQRAALVDDDKATAINLFSYQHARYGPLNYYSTSSVSVTPFGELLLLHYLPADAQTASAFEQSVSTVGAEVVHFAPWPEKKMV